MNTVRSTWLGWGTLCVAGGSAYYFAKRQVNADRQAKFDKYMTKQNKFTQQERDAILADAGGTGAAGVPAGLKESTSAGVPVAGKSGGTGSDHAGSPSGEASEDVAPVSHAPADGDQKVKERSKYEGAPYRSRKGDRFS